MPDEALCIFWRGVGGVIFTIWVIDWLKVIEQVHAMCFNDFTTISSLHIHPSTAACRVLVKERKVPVNRGLSLLTSRIAEERIERAAGYLSVSPPRPVAKQSPRCFRPPCGKSLFIRKCNLIQEADGRAPWERSLIGGPERWTVAGMLTGWHPECVHQ